MDRRKDMYNTISQKTGEQIPKTNVPILKIVLIFNFTFVLPTT